MLRCRAAPQLTDADKDALLDRFTSDKNRCELALVLMATGAATVGMHMSKVFDLACGNGEFEIMQELIAMGYEVRADVWLTAFADRPTFVQCAARCTTTEWNRTVSGTRTLPLKDFVLAQPIIRCNVLVCM